MSCSWESGRRNVRAGGFFYPETGGLAPIHLSCVVLFGALSCVVLFGAYPPCQVGGW
jgi:hypothetical protein